MGTRTMLRDGLCSECRKNERQRDASRCEYCARANRDARRSQRTDDGGPHRRIPPDDTPRVFTIPKQTPKHRERLTAAARRAAIQAKWRREAREKEGQ